MYDLRNALLSGSTPLFIAMHSKIATLSLLLTAVLGTPAAAGVIGEDGRRAPGAEDHLLVEALGLIYCARVVDGRYRRSAGTASIVGNRSTILTAAHVFADESGRRGPAVRFDAIADCVFRQYDSQGNVAAEVAFQAADMGEYRRNPGAPDQDWAVLRTTAPLPGAHRPLPFANGGEDIFATASLSIRIVAFHADIRAARRIPLLSEGKLFTVDYGGDTRLAHTADIGRMSSGAAIVYRTPDGHDVVVGVNRSSANLGDFNLAVPLSGELLEMLRSYAWGDVPSYGQRLAEADLSHADGSRRF